MLFKANECAKVVVNSGALQHTTDKTGRGRNTGFPVPPAQIRTCTLMHPAPALANDGKT